MGKPSVDELFGETEDKALPEVMAESLSEICEQFLEVRSKHDVAAQKAKELKEEMENLEGQILDKMEESGVKTLKISKGFAFTRVEKPCFSLPPKSDPERRHEALVWLSRVGAKELIQPDIPSQTLGAFLKERVAQEKPISELITTYVKVNLSVRKG